MIAGLSLSRTSLIFIFGCASRFGSDNIHHQRRALDPHYAHPLPRRRIRPYDAPRRVVHPDAAASLDDGRLEREHLAHERLTAAVERRTARLTLVAGARQQASDDDRDH